MLLFIVSVATALVVSALCSLFEATLLSLAPSQVADLRMRRPAAGVVWERFKANIERPIAVILLLNTTAHTVGASVAGAQFDEIFGDEWIVAFSLAFTFVMLQFTEILPKTLGVRYNRELAPVIGWPLQALVRAFGPLLDLVYWLNRPFEGRKRRPVDRATLDEIRALASLARLENQIGAHQERIISGASQLSRKRVADVMIPADQIACLSTAQTLAEALVAAHLEAHTRYPVTEGHDRDAILGYVNFKELVNVLRTNPNAPGLRGIIRPVDVVAPDAAVTDLLRRFVDEHVHMAVVRGDGRTLGLVTFEDLVEELVGELEDEFDRLPRMVHALEGGVWMVGGGASVAEVARRAGFPVPDADGPIADWLAARLPARPAPGTVHGEYEIEFTVRRVRRGRIFEVQMSPRRGIAPAAG